LNPEPFLIGLRLHFRNRMALVYSYLFPAIFLLAFFVLYRYERVPLIRHMGELLTVTVLGGACFGLPTTMVSERERGVWRRYRLAPVSSATLVGMTAATRYVILVTGALLQIALAMALGMPVPRHPIDLWIVFTVVAFAFIGLGLVIAMAADNVPAVQALGQCIFLPMLIIGGVAVPLSSLPDWALHVSAFFPGRYAVEALQACVNGDGIGAARFDLLALTIIGAAGCLAGAKLFRWDAEQRFAALRGKGWVAAAAAGWLAVGLLAEARGRIGVTPDADGPQVASAHPPPQPAEPAPDTGAVPSGIDPVSPLPAPTSEPASTPAVRPNVPDPGDAPAPGPASTPPPAEPEPRPARDPEVEPPADRGRALIPTPSRSWRDVTLEEIDREIAFDRLPPDAGVVTPIAPADEEPDPEVYQQLDTVRMRLPEWPPGQVDDPVQRVRNYLFVAAVPDVFQLPVERYLPHVVFERIEEDIPRDDLARILYWIAIHPGEGSDAAVDQLRFLELGNGPSDIQETRQRVAFYAVKLLGRITGRIPRG
jgi:ABC-2 type transport system permease protein